MRKLLGAALALACLIAPAEAQQLPTENAYTGRYTAGLPTFASGQIGPLTVDQNGRLILAPSSTISISNLPAIQPVSQSGLFTVTQGSAGTGAWKVDGSGSTQPISAAALPLPAGAATAAGQSAVQSAPGTAAGTAITVQGAPGGAAVPVSLAAVPAHPVTNAGTFAVQNTAPVVGGNTTAVKTDGSGTIQPVSVAALPLPAGAATIVRGAFASRSMTVTTTAATLMPANANRQGWKIKNDCTVGVWVNFEGVPATAAPGSGNFYIAPGGYLASEPTFVEAGVISVIAASGTCALTAREF